MTLTRDRFVEVLQDELDLDVTADDLHLPLDALPGWDSVRTLALFTALERETARELSLPDLLEARTLQALYETVTA
jgi:acyl carrier protein